MDDEQSVNQVAAALHNSVSLFVRQIRLITDAGELTPPEFSALRRLSREGPATTTALASAEQITTQSMGATISTLENRGFVERRPDPGDGRKSFLSLTDAGRQVLLNNHDARTNQLAIVLSAGFSADELSQLMGAASLIERLAYLL